MRDFAARHLPLLFPGLICASVLVIVVPLPPAVMDLLLSGNLTLSVVLLLATIYVRNPLELSVFPTVLLALTLARLVLNIATTRLILSGAAERGTQAAGGVIEAFGSFVADGSIAIGVIMFAVLLIVNWLVVTKGSTRISEVAARFALDGMPGKQMAIDADLSAGVIDSETAQARRNEVAEQADFYGSMDGASKFVRGDAVAGLVITLINVFAGLYIGVFENGMSVGQAASVFTTLTIGDGLVSQVPAFLVSIASGLIVTRSANDQNLQSDMLGQLFRHPAALHLSGAFLAAMSFTGLPTLPLLSLAAGCVAVGYSIGQSRRADAARAEREAEADQAAPPEPQPEDRLGVDALELELGVGLLKLADAGSGGDLLDRVTKVRHRIAEDLGMILPKVRIRDNVRLPQTEYQISLRGAAVAWGEIVPDAVLAIDTGQVAREVPGLETRDPAFDRPARWVERSAASRAEMSGYSIAEPTSVIVTHLTEVVREHAGELLGRQQVHALVDHVKEASPQLVGDLIPDVFKVSHLHQVLTGLLEERLPIRDLEAVLETLGDYAERTKEPVILVEYVRHKLARTICKLHRDRSRTVHCVTIDPTVEDVLGAGLEFGEQGLVVKLSPQTADAFNAALGPQLERLTAAGFGPVLVVSPQVRAGVRHITAARFPRLAVLSLNEITRDTSVESHGQVDPAAVQEALRPAPAVAPPVERPAAPLTGLSA